MALNFILFTFSAIHTNNNLSPFFSLERGTRQGCPICPLLFALVIQPLDIAIRNDVNINGKFRTLYADDTLLYISESLKILQQNKYAEK